jgi:hypothetical protein
LLEFAVHAADEEVVAEVASAFAEALAFQEPDGRLPAKAGVSRPTYRSDVLAQALRLGAWLDGLGYLNGRMWRARLDRLAVSLLELQGTDSGMPFGWPGDLLHHHRNAWAAMFAHQALAYHLANASGVDRPALDPAMIALLV